MHYCNDPDSALIMHVSFLFQWINSLPEWADTPVHSEWVLEGSGCFGRAAQEQPVSWHGHSQAQRSDDLISWVMHDSVYFGTQQCGPAEQKNNFFLTTFWLWFFLNACYLLYCAWFFHAYVNWLVVVNQNLITGSSGETTDSFMTYASLKLLFQSFSLHKQVIYKYMICH